MQLQGGGPACRHRPRRRSWLLCECPQRQRGFIGRACPGVRGRRRTAGSPDRRNSNGRNRDTARARRRGPPLLLRALRPSRAGALPWRSSRAADRRASFPLLRTAEPVDVIPGRASWFLDAVAGAGPLDGWVSGAGRGRQSAGSPRQGNPRTLRSLPLASGRGQGPRRMAPAGRSPPLSGARSSGRAFAPPALIFSLLSPRSMSRANYARRSLMQTDKKWQPASGEQKAKETMSVKKLRQSVVKSKFHAPPYPLAY